MLGRLLRFHTSIDDSANVVIRDDRTLFSKYVFIIDVTRIHLNETGRED